MAQRFSEFARDINDGVTDVEVGEALAALAEAVRRTSRPGTITWKITIEPGGDERVIVRDEVKVSEPQAKRSTTTMFVLPDGKLSRRAPHQVAMDIAASEE